MALQLNWMNLARQGAVSALYIGGAALAAYNFTAFKSDKYGVYFQDDNQFWLAIGVALVMTGWVVRNWKKI